MNNTDPSQIILESTSKLFEYERISREIEECSDIDTIKDMLRCYVKLYMKQQEVVSDMLK
jgi:hypothetical protein